MLNFTSFNGRFNVLLLGFAVVFFGFFAVIGFLVWLKTLKSARLVEDTGTSTVRSAAQGYVELMGTQHQLPGQPVVAPLTGKPCTWWHYEIVEYRRSWADYGRRTNRVVIEKGISSAPILFRDATGELVVNPEGAMVETSHCDRWWGTEPSPPRPMTVRNVKSGKYQYMEKRMRVGEAMYAAGELKTVSAHRQADEYQRVVANELDSWKRDQPRLLARFDADRNGRIDGDEWEVARQTIIAEVPARVDEDAAADDRDVLQKPADGKPFRLSTRSQVQLAQSDRNAARVGLFLLAFGVGWLIYLASKFPW